MTEINWKDNLRIAWFGNFLTGASISLVVPFMPIFVENLGVESEQVAFYAGLAISVSAISAALFSPWEPDWLSRPLHWEQNPQIHRLINEERLANRYLGQRPSLP